MKTLGLLVLNIVGGLAVLGSYAAGFTTHPQDASSLWGGVPDGLKPVYTLSMLTAAVGYFPFTYLFLFHTDPDRTRIAGTFGFGWVHVLYALVLIPSALWMPLTFRILKSWDPTLWVAIRVVLILVGLGSLGILGALLTLTPAPPTGLHRWAIAGAVAFCVQTALLDATVWPAYFPGGSVERHKE